MIIIKEGFNVTPPGNMLLL